MDLGKLYNRIAKVKNDLLMEEPCPIYEPQWEELYGTQNEPNTTRTPSHSQRVSGDD